MRLAESLPIGRIISKIIVSPSLFVCFRGLTGIYAVNANGRLESTSSSPREP